MNRKNDREEHRERFEVLISQKAPKHKTWFGAYFEYSISNVTEIPSKKVCLMALCEIHLNHSEAIGKMSSLRVILPEGKRGPFPVLYLLHGLGDDHTAWTRRTNLERYLEDWPLIVVMPDSERGWYTDAAQLLNRNFETYIARELVDFVDASFQTIPCRQSRALAGLSMGGYGAIKLALKHPDLFGAAVSHSGAFGSRSQADIENPGAQWAWLREFVPVFGEHMRGSDNDVFALAEKYASSSTRSTTRSGDLALRLDCGTDDFLIEENRAFHAHLQQLGIAHEYAEHDGEHNWSYWDAHIQDTLEFVARAMNLSQ